MLLPKWFFFTARARPHSFSHRLHTRFRRVGCRRLRRYNSFGADFSAASVGAAFFADIAIGVVLAEIPFTEPEIRRRGTETGSRWRHCCGRRRRRRRHKTYRLNAFLTAASLIVKWGPGEGRKSAFLTLHVFKASYRITSPRQKGVTCERLMLKTNCPRRRIMT